MELKQRFAILNDKKKLIKTLYPEVTNESGIYCFYRTNEDGVDCCYIGQAKNLLTRTAQHLMGRQQHIDKSLYVHKLYNLDNKNGWKLTVLQKCGLDELDYLEQHYIKFYSNIENVKVYNVTGGGQFNKKGDIGERQQTKLKSYKNGKNLGYEKARKEIQVFFEKYLDYTIKGKTTKTKERKLSEFKDWLEVQNGEDKEDFVLYGAVLKRIGVDLKQELYKFLAKAKENKMPSFETVTRCRRHIQELRTDLIDTNTAIAREENIERFKEYNLTDIRSKK